MYTSFAPRPIISVIAIAMLAAEIVIHAVLAPDHLEEVPYIGVGFVVSSVLLTGVALVLVVSAGNRWAWLAGAALCGGMGVLFAISRLVGLPEYHEGWSSDAGLGLWSLPPELIFLVCAAAARTSVGRHASSRGPMGAPATV
jgi:hypothetical protein